MFGHWNQRPWHTLLWCVAIRFTIWFIEHMDEAINTAIMKQRLVMLTRSDAQKLKLCAYWSLATNKFLLWSSWTSIQDCWWRMTYIKKEKRKKTPNNNNKSWCKWETVVWTSMSFSLLLAMGCWEVNIEWIICHYWWPFVSPWYTKLAYQFNGTRHCFSENPFQCKSKVSCITVMTRVLPNIQSLNKSSWVTVLLQNQTWLSVRKLV